MTFKIQKKMASPTLRLILSNKKVVNALVSNAIIHPLLLQYLIDLQIFDLNSKPSVHEIYNLHKKICDSPDGFTKMQAKALTEICNEIANLRQESRNFECPDWAKVIKKSSASIKVEDRLTVIPFIEVLKAINSMSTDDLIALADQCKKILEIRSN